MHVSQGKTACPEKWEELYWVNEAGAGGTSGSLAIRRLRDDSQWYVTVGYMENATVLHGPYPSKDAIEMLLAMGILEV